ncbi:MAG TPA: YcnI family protein [Mycobacterium sp.]|nr:YcnI family protein [Mycobacterium sp.]
MTRISRALQRALILAALASVASVIGLLAGIPRAAAHVTVDADKTVPGKWAVLTFEVPNESENGSLTTQLIVNLPAGMAAMGEQVSGWAAKLDRDVAGGTTRSVTWTANPGTGIPPEQFALFRLSLKLPQTDKMSFPATQTYSDGDVVKWDQGPSADGSEPDHPVPTLTLTAADSSSSADALSRWLAIVAVVVAALAITLTLVRRRS